MKPHVVCDATWISEDKLMQEITLTINGQSVKGKSGDTVLDICRANNIDVPTLCHLEGLSDVGACRLCVVEIQNERKPVRPVITRRVMDW